MNIPLNRLRAFQILLLPVSVGICLCLFDLAGITSVKTFSVLANVLTAFTLLVLPIVLACWIHKTSATNNQKIVTTVKCVGIVHVILFVLTVAIFAYGLLVCPPATGGIASCGFGASALLVALVTLELLSALVLFVLALILSWRERVFSLGTFVLWGAGVVLVFGGVHYTLTSSYIADLSRQPGSESFQRDDELIHPLSFSVSFATLKKRFPEVYPLITDQGVRIDIFDVNSDGSPEILTYSGPEAARKTVGVMVRVYGQNEDGTWSERVALPQPAVIETKDPESLAIVRSPQGDHALAVDGQKDFYEWEKDHFRSVAVRSASLEHWLAKKVRDYDEKHFDATFHRVDMGAYAQIVSYLVRVSFEMPIGWELRGSIKNHSLTISIPGQDGIGAPGAIIVNTEKGLDSLSTQSSIAPPIDGTIASFRKLRAQPDGYSEKEENERVTASYTKTQNLTISGYEAVRVFYSGGVHNSDGFWNEDIIWIKDRDKNWYVQVTEFGGKELNDQFDRMVGTLQITPLMADGVE